MNELVTKAYGFAWGAHNEQMYGEESYVKGHLIEVIQVLHRFGFHEDTQPELFAAAWLHDVLEDTQVKIQTLRQVFPRRVCYLVEALTDEPGRNRAERKAATYKKIRAAGRDAVIIKLADRIANMEASSMSDLSFHEMYKKERPAFIEALYSYHDDLENMWAHLRVLY